MTDFDQIDRAEVDATIHAVQAEIGTSFTWDYERSRPGLSRLYSKAKGSQWNATTDLDWSIDVDPERVSADLGGSSPVGRFGHLVDHPDSPVRSFGESEWTTVGVELQNSILSQFLHGEQGALLCTSRIVETVPWIDAKYYASTQVMDEARHVEVFARYLDEKLGRQYAINPNLKALLDDILTDSRWDVTYLGMQIMVEGLALAAFG
ncbi:MAG TPA: ferritin-like domain-containing protein, partial [Microthrixaceae bacterium]|nr:ferritin-like domain-containing protein [Microthrixaceae bacterium]